MDSKLDDIALVLRSCGATIAIAHAVVQDVRSAGPAALLRHAAHWRHRKRRLADTCEALCRLLEQDPIAAAEQRVSMREPASVVPLIRVALDPSANVQEHFVVILLDARQRPIGLPVVSSKGSCAQVEVHPRDVFRPALERNAHSIILAHNHPSGDTAPSSADVELTRRLCDLGRAHGIPVLDHIIVSRDGSDGRFTSLSAMGVVG